MREAWTDDRLDDLREDMNRGFEQLRGDMNREFARVDTDIRELRTEMNQRFDSMQRTMILGFAALGGGLLAAVAAAILAATLG